MSKITLISIRCPNCGKKDTIELVSLKEQTFKCNNCSDSFKGFKNEQ